MSDMCASCGADQPRGGEIAGRVVTAQGEPVVDAFVTITAGPPHWDIAALTNEQGEYSFVDLIPGEYTIQVDAEAWPPLTQQARVDPGGVTQLDFSLSADDRQIS